MAINNKALQSVTESDLQELIDRGVAEARNIDYKQALPDNTDDKKKEFLRDVTSFANATGGHLVYGVKEIDSLPTEFTPLPITGGDNEILRLENLIRDGVDPRIPSVNFKVVPLTSGTGGALIIAIPKSLAGPHMVKFKGDSKFFSRNSKGIYQLDVAELRHAFLASEAMGTRIRNFRLDRVSKIVNGETPIPLNPTAKVALHFSSLISFGDQATFSPNDFIQLVEDTRLLRPIGGSEYFRTLAETPNYDGILFYSNRFESRWNGYVQIFRDGSLEAVEDCILEPSGDSGSSDEIKIEMGELEKNTIDAVNRYLTALHRVGVEPPVFVQLSLLGVKDYTIRQSRNRTHPGNPIDREHLLFPDVAVTAFSEKADDADVLLRPVFEQLWHSLGFYENPNYDADGRWSEMLANV